MHDKSIYLFYGEEKYLIETEVNKIKKQFGTMINGINFITIDEANTENLISDMQTPAFGYPKKLIIVKNSGLFKKSTRRKKDSQDDYSQTDSQEKKPVNNLSGKIAEYINNNIEMINDSIVMVFIDEEVEKNELYKAIEKNGLIVQYNKLKAPEACKRIKSICNAYKVNIDDQIVKYFVEVCGTDMRHPY